MLPTAKSPLLLIASSSDLNYINPLHTIICKSFTVVHSQATTVTMRSEIAVKAYAAGTTFIATTSLATFKLCAPYLSGTADDNYGTVLTFDGIKGAKCRILLLPPLKLQFQVNEGVFLLDHYLAKLARGGVMKKDYFTWEYVTPSTIASTLDLVASAFLIAVDIETSREDLKLTSCSYTAGFVKPDGSVHTRSFVVRCSPDNYPFCIDAIRLLNSTAPPKVMQNGQYDSSYFLRFNAPLHNWLYDTYNMAHCIYPELPRDLAFISSFYLDNFIYWKDESGTNLYEYNAKDTHNTFWVWLAMVRYSPAYAITNYLMEFPVVFPSLTCAMEGFLADTKIQATLHAQESERKENARSRLAYLLSVPNFNPGSPKQVGEMFRALGYTVAQGTDKKEMQKFKETSLIYEPIADAISAYRGAAKAISTYFELELLNGRLLYSLNPAGTETGRLSAGSSAFWCGTQIQNIPQYARAMYLADSGWSLGAVDKAQSESYCTGYIAQDLGLIHTVTTSPDFHCQNASLFFGVPFDELYSISAAKVLRKDIRTVAKRVNHGANYNMGAYVLLETMGTREVINAKLLLKLPVNWTLIQVCEHLLACFDKAYPRVRGDWQKELIREVITTGKLTLGCGWTRRTFLKPHRTKPDLNATAAHKPQCQSVMLVNRAFVKVWRELQLGKYTGKFRLKAQVHDELVFQATPDIIDAVVQEVADIMVIPTVIEGRLMTIPSTYKTGIYWSDLKD